ncbi:MAG: TolC family protein [Deltaproteobacteria bacterium]|nr:TolC family protein [Deltaproteobacteria bacterium]
MRHVIAYIAVCLMACLGASVSFAAEPVSLKDLLAEALSNNPDLRSMRERVRGMEAGVRAEGAFEDPWLKVEMEDLDRRHPLTTGPGNAMQTRYTVSQTFPFPGKLALKERMASKGAAAAKAGLEARALETAALVKKAWFELAFLSASSAINSELAGVFSYMAEITETRYSTGLAAQQDVIKARIEEAMLTGDAISIGAEREAALARLRYLLGRPDGPALDLSPELTDERPAFATDELVDKAIAKNPEIREMEYSAESEEASAELSRKNYYPDLMAGVAPIQRDGRFDTYDVMVQVNIPLWLGKNASRAAAAAGNAIAQRSALLAAKRRKAAEVREAAIEVEAGDKMLTLYSTGILPQSRAAFDSAFANYQAGTIDFLALLDAERVLKKTRLDYARTLLEYRKKVAVLEKTIGEDFLY